MKAEPIMLKKNGCLAIRVPMKFKRVGGRKEIITPGGLNETAGSNASAQKPLVLALARAHRWKRLLDEGKFNSISCLAGELGVCSSYVGRIMKLTLLAPDIIESILDGNEKLGLSFRRLTKELPMSWEKQRAEFL